jgi:hypothetical protein
VVEEGQEGLVGRLAEIRVKESKLIKRSAIEGLPAASPLEVREGNAQGDAEGPGTEDGWLAKERELAEDLERSFPEDFVGEVGTGKTGDVAAQRRVGVREELLQGGPSERRTVEGTCSGWSEGQKA